MSQEGERCCQERWESFPKGSDGCQREIRVLKLSEEGYKERIGKLEAENAEDQLQIERLTKSSEEAHATAAEAKKAAQAAK